MKRNTAILAAAAALLISCGTNGTSVDVLGVWNVLSVNGEDVVLGELPTFTFSEDGTYSVFAGVNLINGEYVIDGDVLAMGEGAMTKMAGPEDAMAVEDAIAAAIAAPFTVCRDEDGLTLSDQDGNIVLELAPAADDSPVSED